MVRYLEARFKRESVPATMACVKTGKIEQVAEMFGSGVSDLVFANFAFPSRISDEEQTLRELGAIYSVLRPGGIFVTVGWDEEFNDELSEMWYKYVPDGIVAKNFEEWRRKRASDIKTPRNCGLTWYKCGVRVPVEFVSPETSARVMGYLFGRSAANEIVRTKRTRWWMAVGITISSKEEIGAALAKQGLGN